MLFRESPPYREATLQPRGKHTNSHLLLHAMRYTDAGCTRLSSCLSIIVRGHEEVQDYREVRI